MRSEPTPESFPPDYVTTHTIPTTGQTEPPAVIRHLQHTVDTELWSLVPNTRPAELYKPARYVLEGQGKRVRPTLLLLSANVWGTSVAKALPAALGIEVFHTFTLVHDDIMDNSLERRGRETVHFRWDDSTAILVGDYLHGLACDLLARTEAENLGEIVRTFHRMVIKVCEGQALDKAFESRRNVSVEDYFDMIYAKTGALIECSMELGGLIAGATEDEVEVLRTAGRHIGRAFQLQDDLLDITAEDVRWGKPIGGDLIEGKKTFILLRALEQAEGHDRDWFQKIVDENGLAPNLVGEARERLVRMGILNEAAEAVEHHSQQALAGIEQLPRCQASEALAYLVDSMRRRLH